MPIHYAVPYHKAEGFNCPFCHYYAHQEWYPHVYYDTQPPYSISKDATAFKDATVCVCKKCKGVSLWYHGRLTIPRVSIAPPPHDDMPYDVRRDYEEASWIVKDSPRGAAALLRLALQKLMPPLGEKGENLNQDIASLVKKGLRADIQQALDAVRVIGNNAVHPGEMNIKDDESTAMALFNLINLIVENQIKQPREVKRVYDSIPDAAKESIKNRDKKP